MRSRLLALATLWPFLYFAALLLIFMLSFNRDEFLIPFDVLFGVHLGTGVLIPVLMVLYVVAALRNAELSDGLRICWVLLIVLGTFLFLPVYWWLYLRPGRGAGAAR